VPTNEWGSGPHARHQVDADQGEDGIGGPGGQGGPGRMSRVQPTLWVVVYSAAVGAAREYLDAAQAMLLWAGLAERAPVRLAPGAPAWESVQQLVDAGVRLVEYEAAELKELLRRAGDRLAPLEDPLQVDLGAHRWLEGQREENYSDWLAWVLRQIPAAERLFRFLGLPLPASLALWGAGTPRITRELPFEAGRLDIVIRYPNRALIVVEVKCQDGATDHEGQLQCYRAWMDDQREACKSGVLVTTGEGQSQPCGFSVRTWRMIAWELRRLGCEFREANQLCVAAMTLAFAGAVEQNLLGLPARPVAGIRSGRVWDVSDTVSHLKGFLTVMERV